MQKGKLIRKQDNRLRIETKLGQLVAYPSSDPAHPGIYIDLKREGAPCMAPVALVEFTDDDCSDSGQDIPPSIICRVWANAMEEDKEAALKNGMNAHLAKPISVDLFIDTLRKFLG